MLPKVLNSIAHAVRHATTLEAIDGLCDRLTREYSPKELCGSVQGRRLLVGIERRRVALGDVRFVDVGV